MTVTPSTGVTTTQTTSTGIVTAPAPWTGSLQVGSNTAFDAGPSLARLVDGTTAVAWVASTGAKSQDVLVQRIDGQGTVQGPRVPAGAIDWSGTLYGSTTTVSVAGLADGGFAMAWCPSSNRGLDPATGRPARSWEVVVRLFDADGTARGAEQRMNLVSSGFSCMTPRLAGLAGGGLVVSWAQDTYSLGIPGFSPSQCVFRVMAANGSFGAEGRLADGPCEPVALRHGGFALLQERAFYYAPTGLFLARFDAGGQAAGEPVLVDGAPRNGVLDVPSVRTSAVAEVGDGQLLVAYLRDGVIVARRLAAGATAPGEVQVLVAPGSGRALWLRGMTSTSDGGFALKWDDQLLPPPSPTDPFTPNITTFTRRWPATGDPGAAEALATSTSTMFPSATHPLTASNDGHSLIGWQERDASGGWKVMVGRR